MNVIPLTGAVTVHLVRLKRQYLKIIKWILYYIIIEVNYIEVLNTKKKKQVTSVKKYPKSNPLNLLHISFRFSFIFALQSKLIHNTYKPKTQQI